MADAVAPKARKVSSAGKKGAAKNTSSSTSTSKATPDVPDTPQPTDDAAKPTKSVKDTLKPVSEATESADSVKNEESEAPGSVKKTTKPTKSIKQPPPASKAVKSTKAVKKVPETPEAPKAVPKVNEPVESVKETPSAPSTPKLAAKATKSTKPESVADEPASVSKAVPSELSDEDTNEWDHAELEDEDKEESGTGKEEREDEDDSPKDDVENAAPQQEKEVDDEAHKEVAESSIDDDEIVEIGRVNEKGEIVDEEGDVIGMLAQGEDAKKLVGLLVDDEGQVRDKNNNIVGSAEPFEEEADEAEQTDEAEKKAETSDTEEVDEADEPDNIEESKGGDTVPEAASKGKQATTASSQKLKTNSSYHSLTGAPQDPEKGQAGSVAEDAAKTAEEDEEEEVGEAGEQEEEEEEESEQSEQEDAEGQESESDVEGVKSTTKDAAEEPAKIEEQPEVDGVADTEEAVLDEDRDKDSKPDDTAAEAEAGETNLDDEATITPAKDDLGDKSVSDGESGVVAVGQGEKKTDDITSAGEDLNMPDLQGPFKIDSEGVFDANGDKIGDLAGDVKASELGDKEAFEINSQHELLGENGTVLGKVDLLPLDELPKAPELPELSILKGLKVNKLGNIVNDRGIPVGRLVEGDAKKLAGKACDAEGKFWNNSGKVIGQAETLPEPEEEVESSPFEDFPNSVVDKSGTVIFEGKQVGIVVEGPLRKLIGKTVDEDGEILDRWGNILGKAERQDEEEPEEPEPEPEVVVDCSALADKKVNRLGNITDDQGRLVGRVKEGVLKALIGKSVDANGEIWSNGKVIGRAEPIPDDEKDEAEEGPFSAFPDSLVEKSGDVTFEGKVVGKLIEGDAKRLAGKKVLDDGSILSKVGDVVGRAERWDEPDEEPEPEVDMSSLAGKRVNKLGNVVDEHGSIYGRLIEGDIKRLTGRMCDKKGFVRNEGGDVVGKAELIPEAERAGMKEGPFADFPNCTVTKEGTIVTASNEVVGRLTKGDGKILFGRSVDEDGEILDSNGNNIGLAERWEEPETPKEISPMSGKKVNNKGEVLDEDGVIGRLTDGELRICAGKRIDDDGDVVNSKNQVLGHVTLLEDIPEPEPEEEPVEEEPVEEEEHETAEEKATREQSEQDKKLAIQMGNCIEQSLDKIKPILKLINDEINKAERCPKDELDEEELVRAVKPLIEEGGRILEEANGAIRGLDPDGRIAANAKHKTAAREASPEEYRLADLLKELTGHVTETIENAKRKLEGMPHAQKELNPLWSLLSEPLFQILAAVGLLLSGVLGLVGKLLSGLGLGGLVDSLLGGLGLSKLLDGLGLGGVLGSLTGKDSSGKKGGKKVGILGL